MEEFAPASTVRLLVVDPNEDACTVLCELCALRGWEMRSAATLAQAMDVQREFHAHAALIEPRLTGERGWCLPAMFRAALEESVPVCIAVAGYVSREDALQAESRGFYRCLLKPVDFDDLCREVESGLMNQYAHTLVSRTTSWGATSAA
jgi:DNA-binding NtrC family response regulator